MTYEDWNDCLADHFFNPSMEGRRVRLNVTRAVLDECGRPDDADAADFIQAIKDGHSPNPHLSLCLMARHALELWHQRDVFPRPKYPWYFGYLCFFVLAAGEGDFNAAAYYPRLRQLLGEPPDTGMYPHMDQTLSLWGDLEHWAGTQRHGSLGIFRVIRRGNHPYVSLPRAQILLSGTERERLHHVFKLAGIDPDRRPNRNVLASRVAEFGRGLLSNSTVRLVTQPGELREYVLDDIEDELDQFDPSTVELPSDRQVAACGRREPLPTDMILCVEVEVPRARCRARFQLQREIAESDLETGLPFTFMSGSMNGQILTCGGRFPGWSSPLETKPGAAWDASTIDWSSDAELKSAAIGVNLRMDRADLRLFVPGLADSLPGYVEQFTLPPFGECLIAASPNATEAIDRWRVRLPPPPAPGSMRELPIRMGLPPNWKLFHFDQVPSERDLRSEFPGGADAEAARIFLRGGIRTPGERSRYFTFAPPRIMLHGDCSGIHVQIGGRTTNPDAAGVFEVPTNLCTPGIQVVINLLRDHGLVATRRIEFVDAGQRTNATCIQAKFNRDGSRLLTHEAVDWSAGCIITRPQQATPAAPPEVPHEEVDPTAKKANDQKTDELSKHIRTAFLSGAARWADPSGNEFIILHNRKLFCLQTVRLKDALDSTRAAIRAAGFDYHQTFRLY